MGRSNVDKEVHKRKKSEAAAKAGLRLDKLELKPDETGLTPGAAIAGEMAAAADDSEAMVEMAETAAGGAGEENTPAKRKPGRPKKESGAKAEAGTDADEIDPEAAKGARKALRKAMKKVVKKKCGEIAIALVNKVMCGNGRCADLMMSLMEKKAGDGVKPKKRVGPSDAELMMMDDDSEWNPAQARLLELSKKIRI